MLCRSRIRVRLVEPRLLRLLSIWGLLLISAAAFASDRAHLVIVAIDDSGSMKQSDPRGIRLEAAAMLASTCDVSDQLGIVTFGNGAEWVRMPALVAKSNTLDSDLAHFRSLDTHTNFAAPLSLILRYVEEHGDFLKNYDVSVVLMTDGVPDPDPSYQGGALRNRVESTEFADRLGKRGIHIFTIGLGTKSEPDFLKRVADASGGSYSPAHTTAELGDAFLRAVTRIFGLPAYARVQGANPSKIHIGPKPQLTRAYLFRQSSATEVSGETQVFAREHIAVYDLPPTADVTLRLSGPMEGASAIVCVRQSLSFAEQRAIPAAILVDSTEKIAVKLVASGEPQWDRLFMRDAGVELRLLSTGQADLRQPLYADPSRQSYRGSLPASSRGEFEVHVRLESPYAEVDRFLGKVSISAEAVTGPQQVRLPYPSFLPEVVRSLFAVKVPFGYSLPTGSAHVVFTQPSRLVLDSPSIDVAPGQPASIKMRVSGADDAGVVLVPYTVDWNSNDQHQVRLGVLSVQIVPQGLGEFSRQHWLMLAGAAMLALLAWLLLPAPKLKGILVIDQPGSPRRRVVLVGLKAKSVTVSETTGRESLTSLPVRVRAESDRELFTLRMVKTNRRWELQTQGHVPMDSPLTLKQGSQIVIRDNNLKFTFYNG